MWKVLKWICVNSFDFFCGAGCEKCRKILSSLINDILSSHARPKSPDRAVNGFFICRKVMRTGLY